MAGLALELGEVAGIVLRSLMVSGAATLLSASWSIPLALRLVLGGEGRGKRLVMDLLNSHVGIPTVVVGLILYFLLSRSGPLGQLQLLYTPLAITIGQAILITPFIASLSAEALRSVRERLWETLISLGATEGQAAATVVDEASPGLVTSILLGFSRAVGELGVALMLGGNIRGFTRVMTTAIALEVGRGEFELALALGAILVSLSFLTTLTIRALTREIGWRTLG